MPRAARWGRCRSCPRRRSCWCGRRATSPVPTACEHVEPFTLLALRFALAAVIALAVARVFRGPLHVDRADLGRIALTGLAMNAVQFGAMYLAFDAGLGATLASLLHALTPVLTAVLAAALLGERLSARQVVGLVIGVAGVVIVLGPDIEKAGGPVAVALGVFGAITLSLGTLGQRWIGHAPDPWWSAAIQFSVSVPPLARAGPGPGGHRRGERPGARRPDRGLPRHRQLDHRPAPAGQAGPCRGSGGRREPVLPVAAGDRGAGVAGPGRDPRRRWSWSGSSSPWSAWPSGRAASRRGGAGPGPSLEP